MNKCLYSEHFLEVEEGSLEDQREEESGSVGEAEVADILPGDGEDGGVEWHLQHNSCIVRRCITGL